MTFPVFLGSNPSGYNLTRSLRFRSSASAYLSRTPATTSGNQIFTISFWVKRGKLDVQGLFYAYLNNNAADGLSFQNGVLDVSFYIGGAGYLLQLTTAQVFRDPSAWYHFVLAVDTTQATASNRAKLYVNGAQITALSTATYPTQNATFTFNTNCVHTIGATNYSTLANYYDGYLAEINWITGQALTPSSFGSTNTLTGVWQPARYTGTYGTNGFYLPFTDNSALTTSSNVGLGKDFSGNGNYWATNNISITAGVTYDSMTDVPTLTSATAANFAVLNPLDSGGATTSNANLTWASGGNQGTRSTFFVSTGKWYWEFACTTSNLIAEHGVATQAQAITGGLAYPGGSAASWGFSNNSGNKVYNTTQTNITTAGAINDIVMIALDCDNSKIWFGRNGTWLASGDPAAGTNAAFTSVTGSLSPMVGVGGAASGTFAYNFGQRPFAYTPPTGFVALNTYNLPTSTIVKGNTVMDATLYTGNGSTQTITNAAGFKPDLVWAKDRSAAYEGGIYDSVRGTGTTTSLTPSSTRAETGNTTDFNLTSFNSNGFSLGTTSGTNVLNRNGDATVAWQWQAGQGSTSTNTSGTITSTVSVNATAGFSVVTYTGNGSTGTVGHGLGVTPQFIIVKSRGVDDWYVYHITLGASTRIQLNLTTGSTGGSAVWNSTSPTSSVFSVGNAATNGSSTNYVAYCWTPIAGFSAFGSYTGNGSSDGVFVYLGFKPKWLMIKRTDTTNNWCVYDTSRNPYNLTNLALYPDGSYAEGTETTNVFDLLSNGVKARGAGNAVNASGGTYIYMAFAETPTKFALAR